MWYKCGGSVLSECGVCHGGGSGVCGCLGVSAWGCLSACHVYGGGECDVCGSAVCLHEVVVWECALCK